MKSSLKKNHRPAAPTQKPRRTIFLLLLVCLLPAVFLLGRRESLGSVKASARTLPVETISGHPGPWGNLEYVRISIAAPEEFLSVQSLEASVTHWYFRDYSRDTLEKFLGTLDLSAQQCGQLLSPQCLRTTPNGLDLTPPTEVFLALPNQARFQIYQLLARFPENNAHLWFVPVKQFERQFRRQRRGGFDPGRCSKR